MVIHVHILLLITQTQVLEYINKKKQKDDTNTYLVGISEVRNTTIKLMSNKPKLETIHCIKQDLLDLWFGPDGDSQDEHRRLSIELQC